MDTTDTPDFLLVLEEPEEYPDRWLSWFVLRVQIFIVLFIVYTIKDSYREGLIGGLFVVLILSIGHRKSFKHFITEIRHQNDQVTIRYNYEEQHGGVTDSREKFRFVVRNGRFSRNRDMRLIIYYNGEMIIHQHELYPWTWIRMNEVYAHFNGWKPNRLQRLIYRINEVPLPKSGTVPK